MCVSVRIPSVIYNNFYFPPVFVTIPPHFLNSHLCIKSLLCSPPGFVNTVLCDCKTPTSANLFPCDLTTSHVLLLVPCHGFAFLMVRWRVKGSTVALWRGREARVSSVMSAVGLQQCHLRKPRQLSVRAHSRLCSRLPGLDSIFDFNSACCTSSPLKWFLCYITALYFFYSFHFTELQCIHINANNQVSDQ